jgi:hypothetical protein
MRRRAHAVAIHRYSANGRDLPGDLRLRQQSADTWLGALTELDLDRTDLGGARQQASSSVFAQT